MFIESLQYDIYFDSGLGELLLRKERKRKKKEKRKRRQKEIKTETHA